MDRLNKVICAEAFFMFKKFGFFVALLVVSASAAHADRSSDDATKTIYFRPYSRIQEKPLASALQATEPKQFRLVLDFEGTKEDGFAYTGGVFTLCPEQQTSEKLAAIKSLITLALEQQLRINAVLKGTRGAQFTDSCIANISVLSINDSEAPRMNVDRIPGWRKK